MPEKILILGPAWVGDMVLAQSLFKTLKANRPNCIIDVAAPVWTLPLLARMPEVNRGIALPFKHGQFAFFERIQFGKSLRNGAYTQAIVLTNSLKSAILPFAASIPLRTGYLGEMRYGLINDIRPLDKSKDVYKRQDMVIVDRMTHESQWQNLVKRQYVQYLDKDQLMPWLEDRTDIEAIIHMGAISATIERDFNKLVEANIHYSQNLWTWCANNKAVFLYASSAATYGDGKQGRCV